MVDSDTTSPARDTGDGFGSGSPEPTVSALQTSPGRVLLAEEGNTDGWLASDVSVDCRERR